MYDHWINFSIGSSAYLIQLVLVQKDSKVYVSFRIHDNKELFNDLLSQKEHIEHEIGMELRWLNSPDRKASRIVAEKSVPFKNQAEWPDQFKWLMETTLRFKRVFTEII